jgi:hypothetical protein
MNNLYNEQASLDAAGDEGVWVDFDAKCSFKISAISAPKYQGITEVAQKRLRAQYKSRKVPDAVSERVFSQCIADGLVHDWKGVTDKDGAVLECNPENVLQIISDLKRVKNFIVLFAADDENFTDTAAAAEAEQTKN